MSQLERLQQMLWAEIPLTQALGLTAESWTDQALSLRAPLAPNINHTHTAFAGSLSAMVTLAGWSLLWCLLDARQLTSSIVIQDSSIQYLQPVTNDFVAQCYQPDMASQTRLFTTLQRRGRARIDLRAEIWQSQGLAVAFTGRYVVQLSPVG